MKKTILIVTKHPESKGGVANYYNHFFEGFESDDLLKAANKKNNIIKANGVEDALLKLKELINDHSLILTQGAGNTSALAKLISEYQ